MAASKEVRETVEASRILYRKRQEKAPTAMGCHRG